MHFAFFYLFFGGGGGGGKKCHEKSPKFFRATPGTFFRVARSNGPKTANKTQQGPWVTTLSRNSLTVAVVCGAPCLKPWALKYIYIYLPIAYVQQIYQMFLQTLKNDFFISSWHTCLYQAAKSHPKQLMLRIDPWLFKKTLCSTFSPSSLASWRTWSSIACKNSKQWHLNLRNNWKIDDWKKDFPFGASSWQIFGGFPLLVCGEGTSLFCHENFTSAYLQGELLFLGGMVHTFARSFQVPKDSTRSMPTCAYWRPSKCFVRQREMSLVSMQYLGTRVLRIFSTKTPQWLGGSSQDLWLKTMVIVVVP